MYKFTKDNKLLYFQFKLLHYILVTNEDLYKWGIIDSDLCIWCEEEIETLTHIVLECEVIKRFWRDLKQWIFQKINVLIHVSNIEIIFGITNENMSQWNKIYLYAKKILFKEKYQKNFVLVDKFKYYFSAMLKTEKELASIGNRNNEFVSVWNNFLL